LQRVSSFRCRESPIARGAAIQDGQTRGATTHCVSAISRTVRFLECPHWFHATTGQCQESTYSRQSTNSTRRVLGSDGSPGRHLVTVTARLPCRCARWRQKQEAPPPLVAERKRRGGAATVGAPHRRRLRAGDVAGPTEQSPAPRLGNPARRFVLGGRGQPCWPVAPVAPVAPVDPWLPAVPSSPGIPPFLPFQ